MTVIAFDTLAFAKRLQAAGMDAPQAEAFAQALQDVALQEVATKADLRELETRLENRIVNKLATIVAGVGTLIVAILGLLITQN